MAKKRAGCGIPFLFLLVLLAAGAWSVWWFILSNRIQEGVDTQAEALRQAGWEVSYSAARVDGYPFRLRVTFDDLELIAPAGHGLRGDGVQAEAMAYALDRWVAVAPNGLVLGRGAKGWVRVTGEAVRASVSNLQNRPPRVVVEFIQPRFAPEPGAQPFPVASADRLIVNLIPTGGDVGQAGVLFSLTNAQGRPGGTLQRMSENRAFNLSAEAVIDQSGALQGRSWREALGAWSNNGGSLTEVRLEATAGDDYVRGSSDRLATDASGRLVGNLAVEMRGGTAPLSGLADAPGVDARAAAAVRLGAQLTSGLRGDTNLTLRFSDARTHVGPVTLGPAPRVF